jgi:hypothetical protein
MRSICSPRAGRTKNIEAIPAAMSLVMVMLHLTNAGLQFPRSAGRRRGRNYRLVQAIFAPPPTVRGL